MLIPVGVTAVTEKCYYSFQEWEAAGGQTATGAGGRAQGSLTYHDWLVKAPPSTAFQFRLRGIIKANPHPQVRQTDSWLSVATIHKSELNVLD